MRKKNAGRDTAGRRAAEALERRVLLASVSGTIYDDADLDGRRDAGEGGDDWAVYVDSNDNGVRDEQTTDFGPSHPAPDETIPDGGTLRSAVTVSGVVGVPQRMAVVFDIAHTRDADLTATLVGPSGRRVLLFSGVGGEGDNFNYTLLSDLEDTPIDEGSANFGGRYRPAEPLAPFLDEDLNGEWALELSDAAGGGTGTLRDWWASFTVGEHTAFSDDSGHYTIDGLPAGTHNVRLLRSDGVAQTAPANDAAHTVTVSADEAVTGKDFGRHWVGQNVVTGTVYDDANRNGAFDPGEAPLAGRSVYNDANGNGVFDPNIAVRAAADVPRVLDAEETYSRIVVTDLEGTPTRVTVTVDVDHVAPREIDLTLITPEGLRVTLGDNESDYRDRTFDRLMVGGAPMNGTWTLEVEDEEGRFRGTIHSWHIAFVVGPDEYIVTTDSSGRYAFEYVGRVGLVPAAGELQTQPAGGGVHQIDIPLNEDGEPMEDQAFVRNFGVAAGAPAADVVGRHVFYEGSAFDRSPAGDDAAVAADKAPLLPGEVPTFANLTSFVRGINGIMIDVAGLPAGSAFSAADFVFRTGNSNDLSSWTLLASAPAVSVRRGAGAEGADRVSLAWAGGAARNAWLEVTVLANERTGLSSPDVFYFGNLVGEAGNNTTGAAVTAADVVAARPRGAARGAAITDRRDFNRDGRVNVLDTAVARGNVGRQLVALATVGLGGGPAAGAPFSDAPVAGAARAAYRPQRVWDERAPDLLG